MVDMADKEILPAVEAYATALVAGPPQPRRRWTAGSDLRL